jgi:hypothetical protein
MIFLLLFTLGILAVPVAWDIARHGRDNILRRSWSELLDFLRRRRSWRELLAHSDLQVSPPLVLLDKGQVAIYVSSFVIIAMAMGVALGGRRVPDIAESFSALIREHVLNLL